MVGLGTQNAQLRSVEQERKRTALHDLSMPIVPGAVFRDGTPPVSIVTGTFRNDSEGEYDSVIVSMSSHTATHIDLVFPERHIAPERMIGCGKKVDVRGLGHTRVRLSDVADGTRIGRGDYVLFCTGWSERYGTPVYADHPELSREVVEWLITKEVNAVGIDALGLGQGRAHGEYDRLLAVNDILVIENLSGLAVLPAQGFTVFCLPLNLPHTDAIPARVLASVELSTEAAAALA